MADQFPEHFKKISLYEPLELINKQEEPYDLPAGFFSFDNLSQFVPPNMLMGMHSLYKAISEYKFLNAFTDKPAALIAQIALLRSRIILIITVYKTIELMVTAFREYREFTTYGL